VALKCQTEMFAKADRSDSRYRRVVESLLRGLMRRYTSSRVVFSKMRGVFPADLIRYEASLKTRAERERDRHDVPIYDPQLHALNYEWYFTRDVATAISQEFVRGKTICLGVPTVASAALKGNKSVVVIDQNAHVMDRFPELARASEIHLMDAVHAGGLNLRADTVVFDSPWYLGDNLAWLLAAFRMVKQGGTIIFALLPSLVRPTAMFERELILEVAASMGSVHVAEDILQYETPLFELEALKACGLWSVGNWRRGDLVVVTNRKLARKQLTIPSSALPKRRKDVDGLWNTFVVGSQVIKLRATANEAVDGHWRTLLRPVDGSFVLPSVSVRSGRRKEVDAWTSRNRVASTGNARLLFAIFNELQAGAGLSEAIRPFRDRLPRETEQHVRTFLMGS
jgi:hypothetical protein